MPRDRWAKWRRSACAYPLSGRRRGSCLRSPSGQPGREERRPCAGRSVRASVPNRSSGSAGCRRAWPGRIQSSTFFSDTSAKTYEPRFRSASSAQGPPSGERVAASSWSICCSAWRISETGPAASPTLAPANRCCRDAIADNRAGTPPTEQDAWRFNARRATAVSPSDATPDIALAWLVFRTRFNSDNSSTAGLSTDWTSKHMYCLAHRTATVITARAAANSTTRLPSPACLPPQSGKIVGT